MDGDGAHQAVENGERTDRGTFAAGNSGRPKGSKNRVTREARETFEPLGNAAVSLMRRHISRHLREAPECATCRHYVDLIFGYIFGRPTQRAEVRIEDVRDSARRIARELGIDEDLAVREAEAIVRGDS